LPPHAPDNLGPCGLEQQWTSAAGATLSIIGTAIVIPVGIYALIMHAMYASSFKTMLSILTCLAISDFLFALRYLLWAGWIISDPASVIWNPASMANSFNCLFSAWLGQFAGCASISWSFCAAVYLALVIAASKGHIELDAKRQRDFLISCHLLVWGFSLATCIVGQAGDLFVMSNTGTCWFGDRYIWIFYGPLLCFQTLSIGILIYTALSLRTVIATCRSTRNLSVRPTAGQRPVTIAAENLVGRLIIFVFAFVSQWTWPTVVAIGESPRSVQSMGLSFDIAVVFATPNVGFVNTLVWFTVFSANLQNVHGLPRLVENETAVMWRLPSMIERLVCCFSRQHTALSNGGEASQGRSEATSTPHECSSRPSISTRLHPTATPSPT